MFVCPPALRKLRTYDVDFSNDALRTPPRRHRLVVVVVVVVLALNQRYNAVRGHRTNRLADGHLSSLFLHPHQVPALLAPPL